MNQITRPTPATLNPLTTIGRMILSDLKENALFCIPAAVYCICWRVIGHAPDVLFYLNTVFGYMLAIGVLKVAFGQRWEDVL